MVLTSRPNWLSLLFNASTHCKLVELYQGSLSGGLVTHPAPRAHLCPQGLWHLAALPPLSPTISCLIVNIIIVVRSIIIECINLLLEVLKDLLDNCITLFPDFRVGSFLLLVGPGHDHFFVVFLRSRRFAY